MNVQIKFVNYLIYFDPCDVKIDMFPRYLLKFKSMLI
jgi:hypothetical protein